MAAESQVTPPLPRRRRISKREYCYHKVGVSWEALTSTSQLGDKDWILETNSRERERERERERVIDETHTFLLLQSKTRETYTPGR